MQNELQLDTATTKFSEDVMIAADKNYYQRWESAAHNNR